MTDEPPEDDEVPEAVDMSPEQAAQAAVGDETPTPEGGMSPPSAMGSGGTPWWKKTEPNPDIEDVEPVEQWQEYWAEYLVRGSQKAAGADDAMAVFDLLRGTIGGAMKLMEEYDL